jgi:predicted HAD superfamily Cof-like phosphohydrolase
MTQVQHNQSGIMGADDAMAAHLLMTEGDGALMAADPERVMEEIEVRATQVSSTLESILLAPHGEPRWGLNE